MVQARASTETLKLPYHLDSKSSRILWESTGCDIRSAPFSKWCHNNDRKGINPGPSLMGSLSLSLSSPTEEQREFKFSGNHLFCQAFSHFLGHCGSRWVIGPNPVSKADRFSWGMINHSNGGGGGSGVYAKTAGGTLTSFKGFFRPHHFWRWGSLCHSTLVNKLVHALRLALHFSV